MCAGVASQLAVVMGTGEHTCYGQDFCGVLAGKIPVEYIWNASTSPT